MEFSARLVLSSNSGYSKKRVSFFHSASAYWQALSAAAFAHALIRCARQNPLYARKIRRQFLASRMLNGFLGRAMHGRVLALRLLDHFTADGLKLEQLHLRLRKFFPARTILLDPHQLQTLFQHTNPQLRVL